MLGLFTIVLFVAFLAFIALSPTEVIQIFLMVAWIGLLLPSVYLLIKGLFSLL
jgi:hypothetical protein